MLIGNLTRDPEIKYTPKGTAIAAFGIAVNRSYTTETGEKREEVTFVDLEAYARVAEIIGEYTKKGNPIYIEGRLKLESWDEKASGQKRSKLKVIVENIQLLGGKTGGGISESTAQEADSDPRQRPQRPQRPQDPPNPDAAPDDIPF
jgi:single-strand DNA-binding protein